MSDQEEQYFEGIPNETGEFIEPIETLEIPVEDPDRKGKSWGHKSLQDPTNSGVGDKINEMISNRPSTREWKKLADWKAELLDLYKQYNILVGFKAFGEEEIE